MRNLISTAFAVIVMTVCTINVQAQQAQQTQHPKQQPTPEQRAERQAVKIAGQLALDDATTQKFVSTWTEYMKEMAALAPQGKKGRAQQAADGQPGQPQQLTEAQAEQLLKERFATDEKLLQLHQKYYKKLSGFLTQKQLLRVYKMQKHGKGRFKKGFARGKGFGKGAGKGQKRQRAGRPGRQRRQQN